MCVFFLGLNGRLDLWVGFVGCLGVGVVCWLAWGFGSAA